jgi:ssDNA-binding Zn-finger/Zn-ribbon topoisomerase 1
LSVAAAIASPEEGSTPERRLRGLESESSEADSREAALREKESKMASVGNRWVRTSCPVCAKTRNFTIDTTWRITCPKCGHARELTSKNASGATPAACSLQPTA